MGKETLSNCCCGNLGESSCEVEKNNFCPVCGKQGTLVKNITVKNMVLNELVEQRWRPETIKKILLNEKYIGDALLQKTFTVDFLTKKRVKNEGHVPQYYVENSHEGIIPKELFLQVRKNFIAGIIFIQGQIKAKDSIVVNML